MCSQETTAVAGPVHAGLDAAATVDVTTLSDRQLELELAEWHAAEARMDARRADLLGEWDARKLWVGRGARTAASALGFRRRVPTSVYRRPVRHARFLRQVPEIAAALAAGEISSAHVQRISLCDNPRTHDALIADHGKMAVWARDLRWKSFERELQDWLEEHDQDGAEPDDLRNRKVKLSQTIGGIWYLTAVLSAIGGAIIARELQRLERLLFEEDWAEATARLGCEPLAHQLRRTNEQRLHDAMVLMAERSATLPEDGRRGHPLFLVLTGHDAFRKICELSNGTQVRPAQVAPHLDDAMYETIVFDGPFHAVAISKQRFYRDALRRVVQAMYRGCVDPECDATIDDCDIDHHDPASKGGPTTQENGRPRCPHSNRQKGSRSPPPEVED